VTGMESRMLIGIIGKRRPKAHVTVNDQKARNEQVKKRPPYGDGAEKGEFKGRRFRMDPVPVLRKAPADL